MLLRVLRTFAFMLSAAMHGVIGCVFLFESCHHVLVAASVALPSISHVHCDDPSILHSTTQHYSFEQRAWRNLTTTWASLRLHDTHCIVVTTTSNRKWLVQTQKYVGVMESYKVQMATTVGIPQMESRCICDCPGGETHCSADMCGEGGRSQHDTCVSVRHNDVHASGCPLGNGDGATLCCRINVKPYRNWRLNALTIGRRPQVHALIEHERHRLVAIDGKQTWHLESRRNTQVPLHGAKFNIDDDVAVEVNGALPHAALSDSQLYLILHNETTLRTTPLNNREELSWLRYDSDGGWKLTSAAHSAIAAAHVVEAGSVNCADQTYIERYNIKYHTTMDTPDPKWRFGDSVVAVEPCLDTVRLQEGDNRTVSVTYKRCGVGVLNVRLRASDVQSAPAAVHNEAKLKDFNGIISVDAHSNRFLNLSVIGAQGILVGNTSTGEDGAQNVAFSVNVESDAVNRSNIIVELPPTVNSGRQVCLYPANKPDLGVCKALRYDERPLMHYVVPNEWTSSRGQCAGCNRIGVDNLLKYLNPREWLDGISGAGETVAIILELALYTLALFLAIVIIRRCVWPLLKVSLCSSWPTCGFDKKRKRKQFDEESI